MDPALWELLAEPSAGTGDREVECIIRLDRPDVDVAGVRLVARFGHVATCRVRVDDIVDVRRHPNVLSLKATRPLQPEPELEPWSSAEVDVPPWAQLPLELVPGDERRPAGVSTTGAGVLVGFVDTGLDFDHPSLKNPDGTTRIVALWDQRDAAGGDQPEPGPQPYGYGAVHDRWAIDAALRTDDPYAVLGYHPSDADRGGGSHGLHVCDIAVGNGLGGGPVGVAPEADIAFVHLAQKGTGGLANLGDSARLLEAIHWLFDLAGDRPCVVNCSLGRHAGPHDGRTLAELALDEILTTTSNRCVVLSGGNYFAQPVHASDRLGPGDTTTLTVVVDEDDHTGNELEVWYDGADELAVQVESPTGERSPFVVLGDRRDLDEDGQTVGRIYHRAHDPNNGDNHVDMFLYPSASPGPWRVTLLARRIRAGGVFHAWIERDQACEPCQARFPLAESDNRYTVGTIATGRMPLVVGAYDAHDPTRPMAPFSSSGPTRDERRKPDVTAPGYQVLAARSAPPDSRRSPSQHVRKSGTSMAAPVTAGAVALCLASAPRPLTMREIRALVLGTTTPPHPNDPAGLRLGHGYLDIPRAVAAAASVLGPGSRAPVRDPGPGTSAQPDLEELDMPCNCQDPTPSGDEAVDTIDTFDELDNFDSGLDSFDTFDSGLDLEAELTPAEQSTWRGFVQALALVGLRDRNDLTNMVFFARNPGRGGRKLSKDEPDFGPLSREWLKIRDTVVTPALGSTTATGMAPAPAPTPPAATSAAGAGAAKPLALVATELPWSLSANKYGVPETIRALDWIRGEWDRKKTGATFRVTAISRRGGGKIDHSSHRIGLDVDAHLAVNKTRVVYGQAGYAAHRPLMQQLVDLIRSDRSPLPVKLILFNDPDITGVKPYKGHDDHLHIRFCMPAAHAPALDLGLVYGGGETKPSYTCQAKGTAEEEYLDEEELLDEEHALDEYFLDDDDLIDEGAIDEQVRFPFRGPATMPGVAIAPGPPPPPPPRERVVFVPGLMGTTLLDGTLPLDAAADLCRDNLGLLRNQLLKPTAFYPCAPPKDKRPDALWGETGMLHWLYAPKAWEKRITTGDGRTKSGDARPGRLLDIVIDSVFKKVEVRPYAAFVKALEDEGLDVLTFPYDWRLSAYGNLPLLNKAILDRWYGGVYPPVERTLAPAERVTLVGHSLGGLLSRAFVEDYNGHRLAKRLITIGTPHRGAPLVYLHLTGRMYPFGEHPISKAIRAVVAAMMEAAVPVAGRAAAKLLPVEHLVPKDVQRRVVQYMASAFELLPTYEFVETGRGTEDLKVSYGSLKHRGTGTTAVQMQQDFRSLVRPEDRLDQWLNGKGVDYHFVATSGFSTVSGYHRGKDTIETTKDGDGTVPRSSALPLAQNGAHVTQKLLPKGRLGHQSMCERPDVLAYVLDQLGRPTARAAALQRDLTVDELVEATDKILAVAEKNKASVRGKGVGTVLSVTTLEPFAADKIPLVDPTTVEVAGKRHLANPPAHLDMTEKTTVYSVATNRASYDYVWISSDPTNKVSVGGVLFLPLPGERKVHLVTFNAGKLDGSDFANKCTNEHHAEANLRRWLLAQDIRWQNRVAKLAVVNTSRPGRNKGYSPCKACCRTLSALPTGDGGLRPVGSKDRIPATITWGEVYKAFPGCIEELATTKESLRVLASGGWEWGTSPLPT